MTHTLHRRGSIDELQKDYVILAMAPGASIARVRRPHSRGRLKSSLRTTP